MKLTIGKTLPTPSKEAMKKMKVEALIKKNGRVYLEIR